MTGTATGALVSGIFIQLLPAPTHLVYLVLFAVLSLAGFYGSLGPTLVRILSGSD